MQKKFLIVLICVAFTACSSKPVPEQHLYMLNAEATSRPSAQDFRIGISDVSIAPYLRRSDLMLQVSAWEMRPARYHRWAEPLAEGIRNYLRDTLSNSLGAAVDIDPTYRAAWSQTISVDINRLHGDLDGTVYLDANYAVTGTDSQIRKRFTATTTQSTAGYPALVEAQQNLLNRLADDISSSIK